MRLIDADALEPHEVYFNYGCQRIVYMDDIDEMPTIDAVQVVRCKECRWYINDRLKRDGTEDNRYAPSICSLHGKPPISKDFFCAYGEKMDEVNDENNRGKRFDRHNGSDARSQQTG